MAKYSLDLTAQAIASPARRRMIDRLATGPATMTELAQSVQLSLPAVDKHLHLLGAAGMVAKSKSGRTTEVRLNPGSLQGLADWALSTRLMWGNALDRLEQHFARPSEGTDPHDKSTP